PPPLLSCQAFAPPDHLMTDPTLDGDAGARRTIAITGASGFIGSALVRALERDGHVVRRLVRRSPRAQNEAAWDPARGTIDAVAIEGADAVINLAGEPLDQRWTAAARRRIRSSRIDGTALLARTIAAARVRPSVFLSGSAIGIYGSRGDTILDESSTLGSDFAAEVCKEWEAATEPAALAGVRVAHLRTGLVLARHGGALAKMLPVFRAGFGGRLGSGRQWLSWISLPDIVAAIQMLLAAPDMSGAVNLVAPNPVTNAEFTRVLGRVLRRPTLARVPKLALEALFGEMADGTILASQRVRPRCLLDAGFEFSLSTLESALRETLQE
ncbi:MAG TPA: TIGR01777 family oxidoreductase, partial [Gemmatimonadaceae bacterium]|nr:TIGR01777 family oxidoreductase [Gemmatimonadaceae bacterium]